MKIVTIYRLYIEGNDTDSYVGSTRRPFLIRKKQHEYKIKKGSKGKAYDFFNKHNKPLKHEILETFEYTSEKEQFKKEQVWIEKLKPTLNKINAFGLRKPISETGKIRLKYKTPLKNCKTHHEKNMVKIKMELEIDEYKEKQKDLLKNSVDEYWNTFSYEKKAAMLNMYRNGELESTKKHFEDFGNCFREAAHRMKPKNLKYKWLKYYKIYKDIKRLESYPFHFYKKHDRFWNKYEERQIFDIPEYEEILKNHNKIIKINYL